MKKIYLISIALILCLNSFAQTYWDILGNTSTNAATNYLGTTDANDLSFRTNGTLRMQLEQTGELGIGTTTPGSWLHVAPSGSNESFRTNSSATNIADAWRMFRGTNEMFRAWFATGANALNLYATRGPLRLSSGAVTTGTTNEGIEIVGGTGADAGFVGIGDYTAFGATHLLHAHESTAATEAGFQLSNDATGITATDGFLINVEATTPIVNIRQQENQPMRFQIRDQTISSLIERAEFTYGGAMRENQLTTAVDGFRIWNPGYTMSTANSADHALDLWCGASNSTHIRFDNSGLIQTINLRFEQIARLDGFWFDARPYDYQKIASPRAFRGRYFFNIDSVEISRFSNANSTNFGFMRVGLQPAGLLGIAGIDAARRLEVYDNAAVPQFRITQTDGISFTDLQTTSLGDFILIPSYNGGPAQVGIGTTSPVSTLEVHAPTLSAGNQSTVRIENSLGTTGGIKKGVEIAMSGANTQLIALSSAIPTSSSTGDTYGLIHTDANSGNTSTGIYMDQNGSNTYATGIELNLNNTKTATGSETYGMYNTVTGATPAVWGLRLITNSTSTATGALLYGVSSDITGSGGNQTEVIALRGYNIKSGSTNNYGVTGYAINGTNNYGVYGTAPATNCVNLGACTNAAIYASGYGYTTNQWYTSSDASIKTDVVPISDYWTILNGLNGYRYDYDTSLNATTNLNLSDAPQMGLIAQEVEAVAPELVKSFTNPGSTDANGIVKNDYSVKSINYDGLIPVLIEAIKDLKAQVDSLTANASSNRAKSNINNIENKNTNDDVTNEQKIVLSNQQGIILNQNDPNPFTESTTITYFIPEEIKVAKIIFTSMSGTIINTAIISEKGTGQLDVYSSDLSKGLYTYTLVCDGKVIDSKKMVKQ